jgi:hypothetical protein
LFLKIKKAPNDLVWRFFYGLLFGLSQQGKLVLILVLIRASLDKRRLKPLKR